MILRLCKTVLVAGVAVHLLLVVFNNLVDYGSNFQFVSHVLGMDTVFQQNHDSWRALRHPATHHAFYAIIIGWEAGAMLLCAAGAARLWRARRARAALFNHAKALAILGLTVGLLLWFLAFITIGGEWFLMWQSRTWNGQDAALRMFACLGIILIFLAMNDPELEQGGA